MLNWMDSNMQQYLEPFNFDLCWTELFEIELFLHLLCVSIEYLQILYLIYM